MRLAPLLLMVITFFYLCLSFTLSDEVVYKSCASSNAHLSIANITANVFPPQKGVDFNVTVNGTLDEDVTDGTWTASVSYEGFPLGHDSGKISEFKPLPWAKGVFDFTYSFDIPSATPGGSYKVELSAVDQSKSQLFCIDISFSITSLQESNEIVNIISNKYSKTSKIFTTITQSSIR